MADPKPPKSKSQRRSRRLKTLAFALSGLLLGLACPYLPAPLQAPCNIVVKIFALFGAA